MLARRLHEIIIEDSAGEPEMYITCDDGLKLHKIEIFCRTTHAWLPIDLNDQSSEVKCVKDFSIRKVTEFFELEDYRRELDRSRGVV